MIMVRDDLIERFGVEVFAKNALAHNFLQELAAVAEGCIPPWYYH
jgi:hypothetical protein